MLFGLAQSLRSLTRSPMGSLVQEAHRMARRRLEAGGPVATSSKPLKTDAVPADYVLPLDIDPMDLVTAIETEFLKRGERLTQAPPLIAKRAAGRIVVPGVHVLRLGGGHHGRGQRFLCGVISQIRVRRTGLVSRDPVHP
jgi:hypothetical protein